MEFINNTKYPAKLYQTLDGSGQRFASIVVKASYSFPEKNNERARPATQQSEIILSDVFVAEAGLSAPLFESDLAPHKPRCDILIHANAHTTNNKPEKELIVGFQLASCEKKILVTGNRIWKKGLLGLTPSKPAPFTIMPIHYGLAFGGKLTDGNTSDSICYPENPIGRGFAKGRYTKQLTGNPLPNLNEPHRPVDNHSSNYTPMSFGPVGRSWQPRLAYAGTYDDNWKENVFPLPPADLNELYYQSAPEDQQIDYPKGGEIISLYNLHPTRSFIQFPLPNLTLPIQLICQKGFEHTLESNVDTLIIDATTENIFITWRARFPIKRSLLEIKTVFIGQGINIWKASQRTQGGCCGEPATSSAQNG